ncbi:nucleotidyltransferase domain-containing protein [Candidatus Micrarchaeota archaeon]|nr:nucleotidyltransferase domain-containing protein [Candidatus Micrarchaeota archaeon]
MLFNWDKFKGWKVLEFFLQHNQKIHVKGLAKKLKVSSGTAQKYLLEYEKQGVLEKERTANVLSYSLKETPLTLELKKCFFISKIMPFVEEFQKENPFVTSLVLYGSHAKGTFDEKSDIDLIAISQNKKIKLNALKKMEEKTSKEAGIQVFTLTEWRKQSKDSFGLAVTKNNILLFGELL